MVDGPDVGLALGHNEIGAPVGDLLGMKVDGADVGRTLGHAEIGEPLGERLGS
jgi:hypothetical protein